MKINKEIINRVSWEKKPNKEIKKELNAIIKSDVQKDAVGYFGEFYLKDIEKLLSDQRKEIIEKIEKKKVEIDENINENPLVAMKGIRDSVYNNSLDEILKIIKDE